MFSEGFDEITGSTEDFNVGVFGLDFLGRLRINETNGTYENIEFIEVEGITFSLEGTASLIQGATFLTASNPNEAFFLTNESEVIQLIETDGDVFGLAGNDYIISNDGDNGLFGGVGQDYLVGNEGDDVLSGDTSFALTGDEGDVYRAFQAVFDRDPDLGGFNAFVQEIRLGNLTQEAVVAEFVSSAEFQNSFGALENRAFVEQLFLNIFNREADAGLSLIHI